MFRDQIRRGIALLNRERPGWEKKIAVTKLDLSEGEYTIGSCGCVLAQTDLKMMGGDRNGEGYFYREIESLDIITPREYGFDIDGYRALNHGVELSEGYDILTKEWQDEIRKLRAKKAVA